MLSAALQTGNAHVATHGAADLLLHSYRTAGVSGGASRGPGRNQLRRTAREAAAAACDFSSIVHADNRSARIGVRGIVAAA